MKIKVENMESNRGNKIANQFIIYTGKGRIFQSYNSLIAFRNTNGETFLDETFWDYSRTTGKYRNIFLNEDLKTTREKIKYGKYKLTDLQKLEYE